MKYSTLLFILISHQSLADNSMQPFSGLMPLVGHCWQAPFPDGKKIDTHCFTSVYNGAFIKDQHVVCGDDQAYYGETWYTHDKTSNSVNYRYYNSLGGISDGSVQFQDQRLVFPDESYENNGQTTTYRTDWQLTEGQYVSNMWQQDHAAEDGWKKVWHMVFKQVDLSQQNVVQFNHQRELHCH